MKNPQIKKAFAETEYTPENIQDLKRCLTDPIFFIKKFVKIQHPTKGTVPFDLFPYQENYIRCLMENRYVVTLQPRQCGKTVTTAVFLLWSACFNNDQTILIASKNQSHALEIASRIRFAYEELPAWLKPGMKYYNRHNLDMDNGSRIISEATTEKTGRGLSLSRLYLDELGFVSKRIQDEMWASLAPTLSTGGSAIISSTPNGDTDLFAMLWRGAQAGTNGFVPFAVHWREHPERDDKYYNEMVAKLGLLKCRQEILCEFLSSDALLISSLLLHMKTSKEPVSENMGFKFWTDDIGGHDKTYLVGVDPATGNGNDFTVIEVIEFPSLIQVAELRLNSVQIPLIYSKIKWLLKHLRKPNSKNKRSDVIWSFERNGVGEALVAMIQNDDSPDGGTYIDGVELYNETNNRLGCYTTGKSKLIACMQIKHLIEKANNNLTINSETLLFELKNFVASGGTYQAKAGATDDCVMALAVVIKLLTRLSSYDDNARKLVYETVAPDSDMEEPGADEPIPFGFV